MPTVPVAHNIDWYRVSLPVGRLDELSCRSDVLGLAQALLNQNRILVSIRAESIFSG